MCVWTRRPVRPNRSGRQDRPDRKGRSSHGRQRAWLERLLESEGELEVLVVRLGGFTTHVKIAGDEFGVLACLKVVA